jgi:MFS family permease
VTRGDVRSAQPSAADRYKWVALSNTSLGSFMASLDASIVIVSLPAIFRGLDLNPLAPQNIGYLLWLIMGYLLVTAVLVVTVGRLGDILGRVRIYNAGFVVFTVASIALSLDPFSRGTGALWLIAWRVVQAVGGSMLLANSAAILTDAFPAEERGMALGINQVSALTGQFTGLVAGGLLAAWDWRAVFWVNVPAGIIGTVWAYRTLIELSERRPARIDWLGNLTFAFGIGGLLASINYAIQPYGDHAMGWTRPAVIASLGASALLLVAFVIIENRIASPMFSISLFRIRAFATGGVALALTAISRGGLQFMLIIWLQGIWLPLHGYRYAQTPLWAGIFLLPLTLGILIAGPTSGYLSDRFGARLLSTAGLVVLTISYLGLLVLPIEFPYWKFAVLIGLNGIGTGLFAAPNTSSMMGSVPRSQRGAASGMRQTLQNSGMSIGIGLFFSLLVVGLSQRLPASLFGGLRTHGVGTRAASNAAHLPPVSSVFSAFLGENPIRNLPGVSTTLSHVSATNAHTLTGTRFFPGLISAPFHQGLTIVFTAAAAMSAIAAICSGARGGSVAASSATDGPRSEAQDADRTPEDQLR